MEKNQKSREAVMVEAADWLARLDAHEDDATLKAAFDAWRSESPTHAVAVARLRATWDATGQAVTISHLTVARNDNKAGSSRWISGGIAVAAALVLALGAYSFSPSTSYATAIGESRIVELGHGVEILLNTDSSIKVVKRWLHTRIILEKGEVVLTVPEADAPTTLTVSGTEVSAQGAVADIRVDGNTAHLAVLSGNVDIDGATTQNLEAAQGDLVTITRNPAGAVLRHEPDEISRRMAWRQGRLEFNGQRLSEVAAEFNRYNKTKIAVGFEYSNIRIGGAFDLDKPEAFAEVTAKSLNLPMRQTTEGLSLGK